VTTVQSLEKSGTENPTTAAAHPRIPESPTAML